MGESNVMQGEEHTREGWVVLFFCGGVICEQRAGRKAASSVHRPGHGVHFHAERSGHATRLAAAYLEPQDAGLCSSFSPR